MHICKFDKEELEEMLSGESDILKIVSEKVVHDKDFFEYFRIIFKDVNSKKFFSVKVKAPLMGFPTLFINQEEMKELYCKDGFSLDSSSILCEEVEEKIELDLVFNKKWTPKK